MTLHLSPSPSSDSGSQIKALTLYMKGVILYLALKMPTIKTGYTAQPWAMLKVVNGGWVGVARRWVSHFLGRDRHIGSFDLQRSLY